MGGSCSTTRPAIDDGLDVSKHGSESFDDTFAVRTMGHVGDHQPVTASVLASAPKSVSVAAPAALKVHTRAELFGKLYAAAPNGSDVRTAVLASLVSYSPPPARLIVRSAADLHTLGVTAEELKAAADPAFWAYNDFDSVLASFELAPSDAERRVMGIEGIGSSAALRAAVESRTPCLRIGHLSLLMMEGKVENGEWRWIDEANCVMHTATAKPALLRDRLRDRWPVVELKVLRHEKFAAGGEGAEPPESLGDLIIFDMDRADVTNATGNSKVFCQDAASFHLGGVDDLDPSIRDALDQVLTNELR